MNKKIQVLTMAGMGLLAGAAIGASPAQAVDASGQTAAKSSASHSTQVKQFHDRDRVVGYFRTRMACERAGRIGEWADRWNDYDCDFVRFGFRHGAWALEVERDRRGFGHHFGGHRDGWGDRDGHFGGHRGGHRGR